MTNSIELLTSAERLLAEVASVEDAQHAMAVADAAKLFARQAKLGTAAINHATVIKMRAERLMALKVNEGQANGTIATAATGGGRPAITASHSEAVIKPVTLKELDISDARLSEARQLTRFTDAELSDMAEKASARDRELSRHRLLREARDRATGEARAAADATPIDLGDVRVEHCSLTELNLEPDSVDLMFTDPPYPAEFVPLWSDLGELAAKALKPGGLLVAYSGQLYLPEAMDRLAQHLDYWWMYSITHVGAFFQLRARHTQVGWKPLLVYRKPGGDLPPWVNDIVTDGVREKSGHDWQQSEAEAGYWIERLTDRGGLVVDPFLGSGTTAAVARRLGRRFVGCDVDPLAVARTKERVA